MANCYQNVRKIAFSALRRELKAGKEIQNAILPLLEKIELKYKNPKALPVLVYKVSEFLENFARDDNYEHDEVVKKQGNAYKKLIAFSEIFNCRPLRFVSIHIAVAGKNYSICKNGAIFEGLRTNMWINHRYGLSDRNQAMFYLLRSEEILAVIKAALSVNRNEIKQSISILEEESKRCRELRKMLIQQKVHLINRL